ncbi:MAG: peptidoglycan D,D-transpeptidase FtsI family protein [Bacillota bacterium]
MSRRIFRLAIFLLVLFSLIGIRLVWLSLVDAAALAEKALSQQTRTLDYYQYSRGDFLDTYGRKMTNIDGPCVVVFPSMLTDTDHAAAKLADISGLPYRTLALRLQKAKDQHAKPFCLLANIKNNIITEVESAVIPGVFTVTMAPRYDASLPAVHVLGFVGQADRPGVYEGKSGLEKQYDNYLQGRSSAQVATLVDEKGRELLGQGFRLLPSDEADNCANVHLTINVDYQAKVEEALAGYDGAAVVLDVQNGDILAMASEPKMDPYMLAEPLSDNAYINKAFALYPPASTFKIVLAIAALSEKIPLKNNFFCDGSYEFANGHVINCWKEEGHGEETFARALANSCNGYFADLGLRLGGAKIKEYSELCGLTQQKVLGYQLAKKVYLDFNNSVLGDVVNASIGENGVRLSPLMVSQLLAVCANGGYKVQPRLVKQVVSSQGVVLESFPSLKERIIDEKVAQEVKDMLVLAVREGTGKVVADASVSAAGKTGTSQDQGVWFAGLAPVDNPRWSIAIYLEDASAGGVEGAKVFKQIVNDLAMLEAVDD